MNKTDIVWPQKSNFTIHNAEIFKEVLQKAYDQGYRFYTDNYIPKVVDGRRDLHGITSNTEHNFKIPTFKELDRFLKRMSHHQIPDENGHYDDDNHRFTKIKLVALVDGKFDRENYQNNLVITFQSNTKDEFFPMTWTDRVDELFGDYLKLYNRLSYDEIKDEDFLLGSQYLPVLEEVFLQKYLK